MEDEPAIGRAKTVILGQQSVDVTDPLHVMPAAADVITEFRLFGNIVHLSLAAYIFDGNGPPEARVSVRLRLPMEVVSDVQTLINKALEDAKKSRETAN